ncbi:MAG: hypothetical protein ACE366_20680 [Bradymonadia bacterium]
MSSQWKQLCILGLAFTALTGCRFEQAADIGADDEPEIGGENGGDVEGPIGGEDTPDNELPPEDDWEEPGDDDPEGPDGDGGGGEIPADPEEPIEPDEPGDECAEGCGEFAELIYEECAADGTPEEICGEIADEAWYACLAEECDDGILPDDPGAPEDVCIEACFEGADAAFEECVEAGEDPGFCDEAISEGIDLCLMDCGPNGEPWPDDPNPDQPDDCVSQCIEGAEAAFVECIEAGGNPEDCDIAITAEIDQCLMACEPGDEPWPDEPHPDDPAACGEMCFEYINVLFEECLEAGEDPAFCDALVSAEADACLAACDGQDPNFPDEPGPDEPACEEICLETGELLFAECIESGEDPGVCDLIASDVIESCFQECSGDILPPEEPEEPNLCENECFLAAEDVFMTCVESGEDPALCELEAFGGIDACLAACDGGEIPDEGPDGDVPGDEIDACFQGCEEGIQQAYEMCLESGLPEEACDEIISAEANTCFESCLPGDGEGPGGNIPDEGPDGEIPDDGFPGGGPDGGFGECEEACFAAGDEAFAACLDNGGDFNACGEEAGAVAEACMMQCGEGELPIFP